MTGTHAPTYSTVGYREALEALAADWDGLVLAMPRPSPFLLHGWVTEWWRQFGDGARLAVAVAHRDGRLVGALPLYVRRTGGLRVARFLGGHESALADLLLDPGEPADTAAGLVDAFRAHPFDYCDLFGLPGASLLGGVAGPALPLVERVEAPVLLMPDGCEATYAQKTSSKKRNLHRRRLRQLGEVGEVEFVVGRTRDELEPLLEEAFDLHELRWAGGPTARRSAPTTGRVFHRAALRRLADDGRARGW